MPELASMLCGILVRKMDRDLKCALRTAVLGETGGLAKLADLMAERGEHVVADQARLIDRHSLGRSAVLELAVRLLTRPKLLAFRNAVVAQGHSFPMEIEISDSQAELAETTVGELHEYVLDLLTNARLTSTDPASELDHQLRVLADVIG